MSIVMARVSPDLPLRCRCGHLRGVARQVAPSSGFRFVCYCKDCQAFARFLAHVPENSALAFRNGQAPMQEPDVLDAAGGTDIFQLPPGRVTFTTGTDAMRCLCFSSRVLRWYADCCRTPIANSAASARFSVVGLIHSIFDREGSRSRDETLGPPLCRLYERSATGPLPPNAPVPLSFGLFARRGPLLLGWWMRGLARPNPFFDELTNAPRAVPRLLAPDERAALLNAPRSDADFCDARTTVR
jgi:hypothetical protein